MKRRLVMLAAGAVALAVLGVLAFMLFPFEPTAITHAQETPVVPGVLPPTGAGVIDSGGNVVPWLLLAIGGAIVLAAGMLVAARRQKA